MEKNQILNVLLGISIVLALIFLIWFIAGNSPTVQEVLLVFVLPLYVFVFSVYERLNSKIITIHQEIGEIKLGIGRIEGKSKP